MFEKFGLRFVSVVLAVAVMFNTSTGSAAALFNKFGTLGEVTTVEQLPKVEADGWIEFQSTNDVSLNKTWKITSNTKIKERHVKAATIIIDGELIPVTITGFNTNVLQLKATYNLPGAKAGELRVYLSNGKNYKVSFTTKDEVRDIKQIGNLDNPIPLLKEDNIKSYIQSRATNYYKIRIAEAGLLGINNNWNGSQYGTTIRLIHISPDYKRTNLLTLKEDDKHISTLVYPGEYLLAVSNFQKDEIDYELKTSFLKTDLAIDRVKGEFDNATMLVDDQIIEESLHTFNGTEFD
ncbi:MAG: hypothetical protein ABS882_11885, partial [Lysinibacillus sp.]